jgi:hypothetical protein
MRPSHLALHAACISVAAGLSTASCSLPQVPLEGRACPCAPGWRCNASEVCEACGDGDCEEPTDTGVRVDAPTFDAARDAYFLDDTRDLSDARFDAGNDGGVDAFTPLDAWVPPSRCGLATGSVWCTGFERGEADFSGLWAGASGEVTIRTAPVFRGTRAGLVTSRASGTPEGYTFRRDGLVLPNSGHIYVTFWMRADATRDVNFMGLGDSAGTHRILLGLSDSRELRVLLGRSDPGYQVGLFGADSVIALGEWTCIELDATLATPGDIDIHYTRRGGSRTRLGDVFWYSDPPPAPPPVTISPAAFTDFALGLDYTGDAHTFSFDEVSIGTSPQPCE